MGLSLKVAAERFSRDRFAVWDPVTGVFDETHPRVGKRFRIDRFTTIYHRPTRRSYIRLLDPSFPYPGVVKRLGTGEIYLLSESLNTDVEMGSLVYENLRMSHLVTPPSGGLAQYISVATAGTGEDLGPVVLADPIPAYVDTELQSVLNVEETVDATTPRFLLNYSANVSPAHGDLFLLGERQFLVKNPYSDGGLRATRVDELPPAYETLTYVRRTGSGGYNPTTGLVSQGVTSYLFSGIIGRNLRSASQAVNTSPASSMLELYVYERHVGFPFELGNKIVRNGTEYHITSILRRREEAQWKLELTR